MSTLSASLAFVEVRGPAPAVEQAPTTLSSSQGTPAPITAADRKRAAMWGLKLPVAPAVDTVVNTVAPVPTVPADDASPSWFRSMYPHGCPVVPGPVAEVLGLASDEESSINLSGFKGFEPPAPSRPRRFIPTPEDQAEAAALFADLTTPDAVAPPIGERSWPRHVDPPSRAWSANRTADRDVHRRGVS